MKATVYYNGVYWFESASGPDESVPNFVRRMGEWFSSIIISAIQDDCDPDGFSFIIV